MADHAIVPIDESEAAAVAEIYLRARHAAAPAIPPLVHPDDDVRRWVSADLVPSCDVFAVYDAGRMVGFVAIAEHTVEQLYVDPDHTARGVGTALIERAKQQRAWLELWTFASNDRAQRFYEAHGFTEVRRTDGENEERAPDILYRWRRSS